MKRKSAKRKTSDGAKVCDEDARKRIVTGLYRDRKHTLVVPSLKSWEARGLAGKFQRGGWAAARYGHGANVDRIEKEVGTGGRGTISSYLSRFPDWYKPWQLEGCDLPVGIRAVTPAQIKHAKEAWDYGAILGECGRPRPRLAKSATLPNPLKVPPNGTSIRRTKRPRQPRGRKYSIRYYQTLFKGPSMPPVERIAEFMLWMYGGPEPEGWLILHEWVPALRNEYTIRGLCDGASIDRGTVKDWKNDKDGVRRQALIDAVAAARAGQEKPSASDAWNKLFGDGATYRHGRSLPVATVQEARQRLAEGEPDAQVAAALGISPKTCEAIRNGRYATKTVHGWTLKMAETMLAVAKAAREDEAVEGVRNKLGSCGSLSRLRQRAEELGLREQLDAYINEGIARLGERADVETNGRWHRRGVLAEKLNAKGERIGGVYLPPSWVFAFREKASKRWADNKISALAAELRDMGDCFNLWFLDMTLPLSGGRGRRVSPYRKAVGLLPPKRLSPFRNEPSARSKAEAGAAPAAAANGSPTAAEPAPSAEANAPRPAANAQTWLKAALEKCDREPAMQEILQAVEALTRGKPDEWPKADVIAAKIPRECSGSFRGRLSELAKRRLLLSRASRAGAKKTGGYRLAIAHSPS